MPPMSDEKKKSTTLIGRPHAVDHTAVSASQNEPAFIAPPPGAPVYYGFQNLSGVRAEGFTFGKITDFEASPATTEMRLSSRQTIAVLDWCGKFLTSPTSKRSAL